MFRYGVKPNNAILAEEAHVPMYEELANQYKVNYVAGGATQNSIRAAQWLLQSPKATGFMGAVGKDGFATVLKEACEKDGVSQLYYETDEKPTGTCASLILNNERSLIANLAAANCFKYEHVISDKVNKMIEKAQVFYVGGFPLTLPDGPKTILHLCEHALQQNKTFCLNLAAPFIVDFFYEQLSKVLPYTDFIFCNEAEAQALIKKNQWDCSIEEAALKLSSFPKSSGRLPRTVVFTQGPEPTIVSVNGVVTKYPVPKLDRTLLIDTTGAGDSFVGGFLARLCQGFDIQECVRSGHYTARCVIQRSGCVFPAYPDI